MGGSASLIEGKRTHRGSNRLYTVLYTVWTQGFCTAPMTRSSGGLSTQNTELSIQEVESSSGTFLV